jgi:hypothetical protein
LKRISADGHFKNLSYFSQTKQRVFMNTFLLSIAFLGLSFSFNPAQARGSERGIIYAYLQSGILDVSDCTEFECADAILKGQGCFAGSADAAQKFMKSENFMNTTMSYFGTYVLDPQITSNGEISYIGRGDNGDHKATIKPCR